MNHHIDLEDIEKLYLLIKIHNSNLDNVIIGKLYLMFEVEQTDIPFLTIPSSIAEFEINPMKAADMNVVAVSAWDMLRKVAKGKANIQCVSNFIAENTINSNGKYKFDLGKEAPKALDEKDKNMNNNQQLSNLSIRPTAPLSDLDMFRLINKN
jgi:hypothetical protein